MNFEKYFEYAKNIGFSDIEFKIVTNNKLSISLFHQKVENYTVSENDTIYIRGIVNGNMVSGVSENKNNIEEILNDMVLNAKLIEKKKEQELFAGSDNYKNFKTYTDDLSKKSVNDKINLCLNIEKKAYEYNSLIHDVDCVEYEEIESAMKIVNTKGLKLSYKVNYAMVVLSVVAKSKSDTRTGFKYQIAQKLEDFDVDKMVKDACDDAISSLDGKPCESKKYKVIFTPDVFASFIQVLLSSASGEAVNQGKSMLKDKLNLPIASKKLTIYENPQDKNYPYFYRAFDDEGVATYKKNIIENGVLKTYLYNIEAAKEAKTTSTGNGYGGANIGISTALVNVKLGKKSQAELCEKINNGVLINNVQGLHAGMNPLSGDFSLQASGFSIENGQIKDPINLITIAGNLFDMFKDIEEVGNDLFVTYGGIATPSVLIKKLAISGK